MGIQFAQLILTLTILIVIHEWGHFYFAKRFKCRVEKFYLFFDFLFPISTLMKFSLFKFKKGDTEYGLGWFPLGGYVQIAGMVDEQMDKEHLNRPPEPWEFRAKPRWQRLLIMLGGIMMNIIAGVLIFWMLNFFNGKQILPVSSVKNGIACDSIMLNIGFKDGDKILSVDNKKVEDFYKIPLMIILDKAKTVQVEREGKNIDVSITEDHLAAILALKKAGIFSPRFHFEVDSTDKNLPASKSGLLKKDKIVAVDGQKIEYYHEFVRSLEKKGGKNVVLTVNRAGVDTNFSVPVVVKDGRSVIGIFINKTDTFKTTPLEYGFFGSLSEGIKDAFNTIIIQAKSIALMFTVKDTYKQIGGFYTMAKAFDQEWDWTSFWSRCGMISLMLAFMNFLPIPMLDGGYILFLLIEMITRRNIPEKFILYANYVGLVLLMALMVYANTDFLR
ncbi:MAG: RIP metalloprotease RseP [Bacteroidota bacterium]|jgi:regulator of sigma E protease